MPAGRFLQLVALLLTAAFVLAGCGSDDSDSGSDGLAVDDLVGTWMSVEPGGVFLRFAEDGTYRMARSQGGLDDRATEEG